MHPGLRTTSRPLLFHAVGADGTITALPLTDPCVGVSCVENAACSRVDGRCHCSDGHIAVDGACVPDALCAGVTCKVLGAWQLERARGRGRQTDCVCVCACVCVCECV